MDDILHMDVDIVKSYTFSPNVPSQESPLASGLDPVREAEPAGAMPKVPQGR